ncbi:MAG TPA: response regulator transcription factor [Flavipsychrobacter sp.]|nr:response regulator transcription factor [Flavipsychrobacter sp.]
MPITLAFADDHPAMRSGLASALEKFGDFKVLFQVKNGKELIAELKNAVVLPDICIIDLKMPEMGGLEALQLIKQLFPHQKTLIYSMFLEQHNLLKAYKLGTDGVIAKDEEIDELIDALHIINEEGTYIPNNLSRSITSAIKNQQILVPKLSERERLFLRYYCQQYTYRQIAEMLGVTVKTLERFRENIVQKLGIRSHVGLIVFAMKTGIAGWDLW